MSLQENQRVATRQRKTLIFILAYRGYDDGGGDDGDADDGDDANLLHPSI